MTLLEFIASNGIKFTRHKTKQDEVWVCCPFCNDDRYRLGINLVKNKGNCFNGGCHFRSRNVTRAFAARFRVSNLAQDISESQETYVPPVRLPEDFELLSEDSDDSLFRKAKRYAMKRGLTEELAAKWKVGVSLTGRYGYRVIFPVRLHKKLVGLVGRDFTGTQTPKYLMSTGQKFVWGARRKAEIILAEGIFKAINIEKALGIQCGAMLGHSVTEDMQEQLFELGTRRVIIWPDPDRAGVKGIIRVTEQLSDSGFLVYLPTHLPEKPADEATAQEIADAAVFVPFRSAIDRIRSEVQ